MGASLNDGTGTPKKKQNEHFLVAWYPWLLGKPTILGNPQ